MGKTATTIIDQSIKELNEIRLRQTKLPYEKRVIALMRILENVDSTRQDLANYLGVHIRTLERWVNTYNSGGIDELLSVKPRRQGSDIITSEIHKGLEAQASKINKKTWQVFPNFRVQQNECHVKCKSKLRPLQNNAKTIFLFKNSKKVKFRD